jgi:hypothetical protein
MVNDSDKGISVEREDRLFIPFVNKFDMLNKVSSGLGLSIVKEHALAIDNVRDGHWIQLGCFRDSLHNLILNKS